MSEEDRKGTERAEGKGWVAHASEAGEFFRKYGPEEQMTPEQRAEYKRLIASVQEAADRHDRARGTE